MADRSQTDTGVERLVAFNDDDPRHSGFHVGGHAEGKTAVSTLHGLDIARRLLTLLQELLLCGCWPDHTPGERQTR